MIDRACLSVNNRCNLTCRYCNFRQMDLIANDEALNEDDIEVILNNLLDYCKKRGVSTFKIGIVGAGEPLLDFNKIKHAIEYAKLEDHDNIFVFYTITIFYTITNGTLVNKDMLSFFFDNKRRIILNFSLDGYEKIHNYGKQEFNKTFCAIKMYTDIFKENPVLNCTVSRQTLKYREAVVDFFVKQGFKNVNFSQLVDVRDNDLEITHEEFLHFLQFVKSKNAITFRQNRNEKNMTAVLMDNYAVWDALIYS